VSAWRDCVTAALLGTEKAGNAPLPEALEPSMASASSLDKEAQFLTRAGALALWRRAGWKPPEGPCEIAPAEAETTHAISALSAGHLHLMLGGRFAGVLPEWLSEAVRLERHVPPELLPALLNRSRQDRALRPLAMAAGGRRANWIAAHNPEWVFAAASSPELWETGNRDQRAAILRTLRTAAPAEARSRVEAVWKEESADVRAAFLVEFGVNLSGDDSPFLETALDDRSKEVRRIAVDLLARLAAVPFVARMLERARPLLVWKPARLLGKGSLEVALPAEPDAAAARDGLDPKAFGAQKALGDRAVLLAQILSAVPLRHWTETFSQTPAALIEAAKKTEFSRALATGWAWAALRQRDAAWAEALLDGPVEPHLELLPNGDLLSVLPEEARATRLGAWIRSGVLKKREYVAWQSLLGQLNAFSAGWPVALGREILSALREACEGGLPYHLRAIAESIMLRLPAALLPDAIRAVPSDNETVSGLVELLAFRRDALAALRQP
jgi:Family of unknown function (DUF5691)